MQLELIFRGAFCYKNHGNTKKKQMILPGHQNRLIWETLSQSVADSQLPLVVGKQSAEVSNGAIQYHETETNYKILQLLGNTNEKEKKNKNITTSIIT